MWCPALTRPARAMSVTPGANHWDAMEPKALIRAIDSLMESQPDNKRLRDHFEGLTRDPAFPGLTWYWGPKLYARNRAIFRPLILTNFSDWAQTAKGGWTRVLWTDHEKELEAWLTALRQTRDSTLVRRLIRWKYASPKSWGVDEKRFRAALVDAYRAASGPAARAIVLDEFNDWFNLDEPTAAALYEIDRSATKFILDHTPRPWDEEKRVMWDKLANLARAKGDTTLYFAIYRRLVPIARWRNDALALAKSETDAAKLNDALTERHPEGYRPNVNATIVEILEQRGRDVFPYIRGKLNDLVGGWGRDKEAKRIIDLAAARSWWDLWSAAIRTGPQNLFSPAVAKLLDDNTLTDSVKRERLKALAGVSQEWNWPGFGLARIHILDDKVAELLYERYPDIVRGPYRGHVTPSWWGQGYPKLVARALAADDTELLDTLAARYATQVSWRHRAGREDKVSPQEATAADLAKYYQAIRDHDEETFARRAASVLTRIPAYTAYNFHALLRHNDLARLLFSRSLPMFLASPVAVQDLIEGSDIHVMSLAYRVLAMPDARAIALAGANLDILLGTLLRPIHRKTRIAAFAALANAARSSPQAARRVLTRAKDAQKLPDKRYPKAELIGLIAAVLNACPELAGPREQPVIYRRAPQRSAA
jgi:hypothetical protein